MPLQFQMMTLLTFHLSLPTPPKQHSMFDLAASSPVHSHLLTLGSWNNNFHLRHCNVSGGSQGFSFYGVFVSPLSRAIVSKVECERRSYCRLPSSLEDVEWLHWINDSESRKGKLAFTFFQSFRPRHGETNLPSFLSHVAPLREFPLPLGSI
jgi:hypothetical protein